MVRNLQNAHYLVKGFPMVPRIMKAPWFGRVKMWSPQNKTNAYLNVI
jgi:hypothetical protein